MQSILLRPKRLRPGFAANDAFLDNPVVTNRHIDKLSMQQQLHLVAEQHFLEHDRQYRMIEQPVIRLRIRNIRGDRMILLQIGDHFVENLSLSCRFTAKRPDSPRSRIASDYGKTFDQYDLRPGARCRYSRSHTRHSAANDGYIGLVSERHFPVPVYLFRRNGCCHSDSTSSPDASQSVSRCPRGPRKVSITRRFGSPNGAYDPLDGRYCGVRFRLNAKNTAHYRVRCRFGNGNGQKKATF